MYNVANSLFKPISAPYCNQVYFPNTPNRKRYFILWLQLMNRYDLINMLESGLIVGTDWIHFGSGGKELPTKILILKSKWVSTVSMLKKKKWKLFGMSRECFLICLWGWPLWDVCSEMSLEKLHWYRLKIVTIKINGSLADETLLQSVVPVKNPYMHNYTPKYMVRNLDQKRFKRIIY